MIVIQAPSTAGRSYFTFYDQGPLDPQLGQGSVFFDLKAPTDLRTFTGGDESNLVVYNDTYAYQSRLISFSTGGGDDAILVGSADMKVSGSFYVNAESGDDLIVFGNIQGALAPGSGIDAGEGNDVIRIRASNYASGIFGNTSFFLRGGEGNDLFDFNGTQYNLRGAAINVANGGHGFDTFIWNLSYDLNFGTDQTGVDAEFSPYPTEIGATNIERLILDPDSSGKLVRLNESDVAAISAGSDLDRSLLGVGLEGAGAMLIVQAGKRKAQLDLTGWSEIGTSTYAAAAGFTVYQQGGSFLVVDPKLIGAGLATFEYHGDAALGLTLRADDLFGAVPVGSILEITDADGTPIEGAIWDPLSARLVLPSSATGIQSYVVTLVDADGERLSRPVSVAFSDLSFVHDPIQTAFNMVAFGDINGDGLTDFVGAFQSADGSFESWALDEVGVLPLRASDRQHRDNRLVDFDNDGDLDLIGTTYDYSYTRPTNVAYLFENDGTGVFTEIPSFTAEAIQGFGETIITADFNNDGRNDLYLPYYFRNEPCCETCRDELGNPVAELCEVAGSRLLINQGAFNFDDQTAAWSVLNGGSLSLKGFSSEYEHLMPEGAQALDWNDDGSIDLYVANHFFLNLGGSFYDANQDLGLPTKFDEGAVFFDWNNDGFLDLIRMLPEAGPELMQYNPDMRVFERVDSPFPYNFTYRQAYGVSVGDLNGDGWEDIFVAGGGGPGRIFLNNQGKSFSEYRSIASEYMGTAGSPVLDDINGDGRADLVFGGARGILLNTSTYTVNAVYIELLGANGEFNQHGRKIQLDPDAADDSRIFTKLVDSGSGLMSQKNYTVQFSDSAPGTYSARAFMIDYPTGTPVVISFAAQTGHSYSVTAAGSGQAPVVLDKTTGDTVDHLRTYDRTPFDDALTIAAPGRVNVLLGAGDDVLTLGSGGAGWAGSAVDGGSGLDRFVWDGGFNLNGGNQTGVPDYPETDPVIVGNVEFLDLESSGVSGKTITLEAADVAALVAGSDFDRAGLPDLDLAGTGNVLIVSPGDNRVVLAGDWTWLADVEWQGRTYAVRQNGDLIVLAINRAELLEGTANADYLLAPSNGEWTLSGLGGHDQLIGRVANDVLLGGGGDDTLDGRIGADRAEGGTGDDHYIVDQADDVIVERVGEGTDTVTADVSYMLGNGVEVEVLSTRTHRDTGAINLTGNSFSQTIYGNFDANVLNGRGGKDILVGFAGNDSYYIHSGSETVIESAGGGVDTVWTHTSYRLAAGQEIETLSTAYHRGTGTIDLTGNERGQTMLGNFGANTIDGKGGNDVLLGMAGADTFAFTTELGAGNIDRIDDFEVGTDRIALGWSIFSGLSIGALAQSSFAIGTAATTADHRMIYDPTSGALLFDADGNGVGQAVQFALLGPGLTLSNTDFFVV